METVCRRCGDRVEMHLRRRSGPWNTKPGTLQDRLDKHSGSLLIRDVEVQASACDDKPGGGLMPGWYVHMEAAKVAAQRLSSGDVPATLNLAAADAMRLGDIAHTWRNYYAI